MRNEETFVIEFSAGISVVHKHGDALCSRNSSEIFFISSSNVRRSA
jgi:hypothetical protein